VHVRLVAAGRGSRQTRRHPRDDLRAEVGEDVRVGVGVRVGPVEFQLNGAVGELQNIENITRIPYRVTR